MITAMEAKHPNLTTQQMLYVEISRARDRAEFVTDDREQLEAVAGERIAALEAVGSERTATPEARSDVGRSAGRESGTPESPEKHRAPEPEIGKAHVPKRIAHDLGL